MEENAQEPVDEFEEQEETSEQIVSDEKKFQKNPYLQEGRLADVLALIQTLARSKFSHRTERGLNRSIGVPRSSDKGWREIAREHPEFFRVTEDDKTPNEENRKVSLITRHVSSQEKGADGQKRRPRLETDFLQALMETAINLHDRAEGTRFLRRYNALVAPVSALIGSAIGGALTMFLGG